MKIQEEGDEHAEDESNGPAKEALLFDKLVSIIETTGKTYIKASGNHDCD